MSSASLLCADADEMDFEGFLRMVQVGSFDSLDSLDQYDPRLRHPLHDESVHRCCWLLPSVKFYVFWVYILMLCSL